MDDDVAGWAFVGESMDDLIYYMMTGGRRMQTKDQLQAKIDAARAEVEKYEAALAARDAYGARDLFKNGDIFKVEMRYPNSNVTYTYAVIRVAQRYWLSGKVQRMQRTFVGDVENTDDLEGRRVGWTWENFVAWLAAGDATVWKAGKLEQVL